MPSTPIAGLQRQVSRPVLLRPDPDQMAAIAHRGSSLLIVGGPGTGKTTVLVEHAVARLAEGHPAEKLLVLTYGRDRAAQLRDAIAGRSAVVTREPLARTIHSLCFGLLRRRAVLTGEPEPWLISGPEHDSILRDLLRGSVEEGLVDWPESLRLALGTRAFARELRDLLSRATERGLNPDEFAQLARRRGRADWHAVAQFYRSYLGLQLLTGRNTVDPGALVVDTIAALSDPEFLAQTRAAFPLIVVDEFQESDPSQRALLEMIASELVIALDPDSSVGRFRGAEPETAWERAEALTDRQIMLTVNHRSAQIPHAVSVAVSSRFRRALPHRARRVVDSAAAGQVEATRLRSLTAECRHLAQELRRAHLVDGLPWSEMAVLLRAPGARVAALQRALAVEGIPVSIDASALALADQPAVAPLITMARIALDERHLDAERAEVLLLSPYGAGDPVRVRRLLRELRAGDQPSARSVQEALLGRDPLADLDPDLTAPARRIAALIAAARDAAALPGAQAENLIWAIWEKALSPSGRPLRDEWQEAALAGGMAGQAADRDLDAVVALFETAARFADRRPGSSPAAFLDEMDDLRLPGDTIAARAQRDEVVEILTIHSAKGREWELVAVPGLQEGEFPNLRLRGSLLGSELLVAVMRDPEASDAEIIQGAYPALLDDERRLFFVAISRARHRVLLSAVVGEEDRPSRFFEEVAAMQGVRVRELPQVHRSLSMTGLLGELRRSDHPDAAAVLRSLVDAGVPGADPARWWGLAPISSDEPLGVRPVSPSTAATFESCGLRWFLENHGGQRDASLAQAVGIAVHTIAERMITEQLALPAVEQAFADLWSTLETPDGWVGDRERRRAWSMIEKLMQWQRATGRVAVATEVQIDHEVAGVRIKGKVDRVDRTDGGEHVLVDFKTGGQAISKQAAEVDAQLTLYQLAIASGAGREALGDAPVVGAELVFVGTSTQKASVRTQAPIDLEGAQERLVTIAAGLNSASFVATPSADCQICSVRTSCPAVLPGRMVT